MPSILPNYEYDIFISYRQNDKWGMVMLNMKQRIIPSCH
jgi:hypothetical protein